MPPARRIFGAYPALYNSMPWRVRSTSADDGYAFNDESPNLKTDLLGVGKASSKPLPYYATGMVFRNVDIPRGAEIISASLKL